jgi:hypothetical protein
MKNRQRNKKCLIHYQTKKKGVGAMTPQFHETGYGKKFFEAQLPKLIKSIERVAEAVEESNNKTKPELDGGQVLEDVLGQIVARIFILDDLLKDKERPMDAKKEIHAHREGLDSLKAWIVANYEIEIE